MKSALNYRHSLRNINKRLEKIKHKLEISKNSVTYSLYEFDEDRNQYIVCGEFFKKIDAIECINKLLNN